MIKVSIIIPIYNVKDYITDCLNSVISQTMKSGVECILVDDCGQDDSVTIVESLLRSQEYMDVLKEGMNFSILYHEHNCGPSAARNRGIREAKGEYIFFLDADDLISEDCIDSLYTLAKKYSLDYVQGMYHSDEHYHMPVYINEDSNIPIIDRKVIKKNLLNYLYIPFTPHNRLIRRQFLLDNNLFFPEKIRVREDFYWMFFVAKYVERMAICNKVTYFRGYNGESLTHNINKEREILAYQTLIEDFCVNIDPFLSGHQKDLILNTLIMALNSRYYHDVSEKRSLVDVVMKQNNIIERCLLKAYFATHISEILHLLVNLYKFND